MSRSAVRLAAALAALLPVPALAAKAAKAPAAPPPGAVVDRLHGLEVEDPFRAYETDEGAKAFVDAQNEATRRFLAKQEKRSIETRLDQLSQIGTVGRVSVAGKRTFFVRRVGTEEQGSLFLRSADGTERKLVDPAALDRSGKVALDWYYPSPSGKLLAYGLSRDGSEESVLHLLSVETGQELVDTIPTTRAASLAWLPDESGFFYTRYPPGDRYHRHVWLHRLGDDPAKDVFVFGKELVETDWPDLDLSEDGRHLFINVSKGWAVSELWVLDRAAKEQKPARLLSGELGALFGEPLFVDGKVIVRTNHRAPNFKIVAVDPEKPAPEAWTTLVAEGDSPLDAMVGAGGRLAVVRLVKAVSRLELYGVRGQKLADVPLPDLGAISAMDAEFAGDRLVFAYASFLRPSAIFELPLGGGEVKELVTLPGRPDTSGYVVEQLDYPSYDGTRVPMFVVRRKDTPRNGSAQTLLTGYGGFNISISPAFSPNALFWVERGGIYALANLRGGAEFGKTWHDAGRLGNKHQVFRDMEYAMRHLIRAGFTRPDRLAITGGSNGGLLMGAMMTQAPELFRAAVGRVGLYDMLRYQNFLIAKLWVDEYGSSENASQIGYLHGYSPYHQVMDGVRYPAFFGLTARTDTRVSWVHTAKFVARLQQAQAGAAPILFHLEEKAGHGAGKGRSDRLAEDVMMFQFVLSQLEGGTRGGAARAGR